MGYYLTLISSYIFFRLQLLKDAAQLAAMQFQVDPYRGL